MGIKADFYSGLGSKQDWIGSLYNGGEVWNIPLEILIQVNEVMFEELTIDFLKRKRSSIPDKGNKWPWLWSDSRMTDYSYIFLPKYSKVFMCVMGNVLIDPIKILQGEDIQSSHANIWFPDFPYMLNPVYQKTEEMLSQHGHLYSKII